MGAGSPGAKSTSFTSPPPPPPPATRTWLQERSRVDPGGGQTMAAVRVTAARASGQNAGRASHEGRSGGRWLRTRWRTLSGTTSVRPVNGRATFSTLSINTGGTRLHAGGQSTGLTGPEERGRSTSPRTPPRGRRTWPSTTQPAFDQAGQTMAAVAGSRQWTLRNTRGCKDSRGRYGWRWARNPGGGIISVGTTSVAAVKGVATVLA